MASGRIRVGIGGWVYEPWRGTFYPEGLSKTKELAHASRAVTAIEINATFYRTQSPASFARWAAETPDDFVFSVKANRFCVNRKDLADGRESIERFVASGITSLGAKLGPILWQLARTKKFRADEIEGFLTNLPREQDGIILRHAIEPRHATFKNPEFVALARKYNIAIVLADSDEYPLIADASADFCYLRLQSSVPTEASGYEAGSLLAWTERIRSLARGHAATDLPLLASSPAPQPRDCYVFFIAGAKEHNPAAAQAMLRLLNR